MNAPNPLPSTPSLPSGGAAGTATVASGLIAYGVAWAAQKYGLPADLTASILGVLFTGVTSLWHRAVASAPPK